jgi:mRNA interferase MazF
VLSIDAINRLPLVVTVVVGTKGENITRDYPTNVRLSLAESGLPMETVFLGFQVRSLDPKRLSSPPTGRVTGAVLRELRRRCGTVLASEGAAGGIAGKGERHRRNPCPHRT